MAWRLAILPSFTQIRACGQDATQVLYIGLLWTADFGLAADTTWGSMSCIFKNWHSTICHVGYLEHHRLSFLTPEMKPHPVLARMDGQCLSLFLFRLLRDELGQVERRESLRPVLGRGVE